MSVVPYKDSGSGKKEQVAAMFDNISPKYDFLNHFLSLGIDIGWRKKAINILKAVKPTNVLDVATGTADLAIAALDAGPKEVIGIDISGGMLDIGRQKLKAKGLDDRIKLVQADSEALPFADNSFDAVTVAFGVRNFENLETGLAEMLRVLRPGGKVIILEFSKPKGSPMKQLFGFYSQYILPTVGRIVSRDTAAYDYLPESVRAFPDGQDFLNILSKTGYTKSECTSLTFGISSIYTAVKP